jgi:dihydrofolate reductase
VAASGRDIRIGGGANLVQQYLNARLVDEFTISLAPVLLGGGTRLFECIDFGQVVLGLADTLPSARVTHLTYAVSHAQRRGSPLGPSRRWNHLRQRRRSDAVYAKGVSVAPAR